MEFTIKKIISIDNDAENFKRKQEDLLDIKKKEFEAQIEYMRQEAERELAEEKKKVSEAILNKAMNQAKDIEEKREERLEQIIDSYKKIKDSLSEELFNEVRKRIEER